MRALMAVLAVAASAAPAAAATRYVAPTGTGVECAPAAPCSLQTSFTSVGADTEIVVAPGDYGSAATPLSALHVSATGLQLHGPETGQLPHIFISGSGLDVTGSGSSVRRLQVENPLTAPDSIALEVNGGGSKVDGVIVHTAAVVTDPGGHPAEACETSNGTTWTSSICWGGKANAMVLHGNATLRNVTFSSTDGFAGLAMFPGGPASITATNMIVLGGIGSNGGTLTYDHSVIVGSSFGTGTLVDNGANSTDAPVLVDVAHGDFHETALSGSTIDQGAATPGFDVDGDVRTFGLATDIGADERAGLPGATLASADGIGDTTATVHGTVDPGGSPTSYHFDYGAPTPDGVVAASIAVTAVSATLTGLTPGTPYHVHLIATNQQGTATSDEVTFTTTTSVVPPPLVVLQTDHPAVSLGKTPKNGVPIKKGLADFTFSNATDQTLAAAVQLVARAGAARERPLSAVSKRNVAPRSKAKFKLKITGAARRQLRRHRLKATLVVKLRSPDGVRVTLRKPVVLKRSR